MLRPILALCLSTSLFALAACGDDGAGGGGGKAGSDLRTDFSQAADALLAKTGQPGEKAEMPPASDPAVQAFEAQAGEAMTALGTDRLKIDCFESYEALCGKTAAIVGAYASAGVGADGADQAAQQSRMEANVGKYMDRMFTPLLFAAHCNAEHMPFLEEQVGDAGAGDARAAAVNQVRSGVFQQAVGLAQMASDPGFDDARRRRIVELLAADASNFAIALTPAQREQLAAAAQRLEASLPADLKPQAQKIRAAVQSAPCGNICSIG